jgi:hypothetical protein
MAESIVTLKYNSRVETNNIAPASREFSFSPSDSSSSVKVISDFYLIAGSATDTVLTFATQASAIATIFIDPDNTGDLTLKINGDSNGNTLAPRRSISGALTALTVTNASVSQRQIKTYTIIPNGNVSETNATITNTFLNDNKVKVSSNDTTEDFLLSKLTAGAGITLVETNDGANETITVAATSASGDVIGPASSTDNAVVRFDTTTGKLIQNSTVTIDDSGVITGSGVNVTGLTASEIVITDASKNLASGAVATYPSLTELTYVKGVTSAIQTQLNAKGAGDALTSNPLSQFAATTSAQLAGVISDETGSGALVFATSPTLVTPVLGVAAATSINKVALTAPATSATITATDGTTTTLSGGTHSGTNTGDQTNISGNAATVTTNANLTGHITSTGNAAILGSFTSAQLATALSDETGTGAAVFAGSPTFTGTVSAAAISTTGTLDLNNNNIQEVKTASFNGEIDDGNSSTADTIDFGAGNNHKSTMTGACTYTFTAPAGPASLVLKLVQDATGSRVATWPATVKWSGGTAPTLTTTANAIDIVTFYFDGTNYYGAWIGDFS